MGIPRRHVVIAVAVVLAGMAYLVMAGMRDTLVFYFTVSELSEQSSELTGERLRVAGKVMPGTIEVGSNHLVHRFTIEEGGRRLRVVYSGVAPDTFVDNSEAVVEGRLQEDGTFAASFLMAKCPSKYESETDYAKYRENGVVGRPRSST